MLKDLGGLKKEEEVYNPRPVMKFAALEKPTTSEMLYNTMEKRPGAKAQAVQKTAQGSTDEKMNAFLDEMRQQFLQT